MRRRIFLAKIVATSPADVRQCNPRGPVVVVTAVARSGRGVKTCRRVSVCKDVCVCVCVCVCVYTYMMVASVLHMVVELTHTHWPASLSNGDFMVVKFIYMYTQSFYFVNMRNLSIV